MRAKENIASASLFWFVTLLIYSLALTLCKPALAWDPPIDIFDTVHEVPKYVTDDLLHGANVCIFKTVSDPITLVEAVERALCNNPVTRQTWANIKIQAAAVGVARAGYFPQVKASLQDSWQTSGSTVAGHPNFDSDTQYPTLAESISLSWILYDFGGRSAALKNANELLSAAQAIHEASLQTVFLTVATDFYTAQAAQGTLRTTEEVEQTAKDSADAAIQRVDKGVAPISDSLQAQTEYAQAVFNHAKAQGDFLVAQGKLATDMSLAIDTPLNLPEICSGITADEHFKSSVKDLIEEAKRSHPDILSAKAQLRAAEANVQKVSAEGWPSVNLDAKIGHNNAPVSPGLGEHNLPATGHDFYIGITVNVPIFEGFSRRYLTRQAQAEADAQLEVVNQAEHQVSLDIWTSYQTLQATTLNVENSFSQLHIAQLSYEAAMRRYLAGVGNIMELLNTQGALASSKHQRIQALTDWRISRLSLGAKLGELGMWSIRNE